MENCKDEFISHTQDVQSRITCAKITHDPDYGKKVKVFTLKVGYSANEYEDFLQALDFDYDDGYGGQELFGFIWYDDGTWSERGEYDGPEWWEHMSRPAIPDELRKSE